MPPDGGGCRAAHDEQQRPNRSDRQREPPRSLTTAGDHALESTCLIAGQMPRAVLGQRLGGKRLDAIGHRLIVGQTLGSDNGRPLPDQVPGADTTMTPPSLVSRVV